MAQYWFPVALALVVWKLVDFGKLVWTRERANANRTAKLLRWSLPLHAPALGAALGAIPTAPWPEPVSAWGSPWPVIAGAAVGVACSWVVGAVKHAIEARGRQ